MGRPNVTSSGLCPENIRKKHYSLRGPRILEENRQFWDSGWVLRTQKNPGSSAHTLRPASTCGHKRKPRLEQKRTGRTLRTADHLFSQSFQLRTAATLCTALCPRRPFDPRCYYCSAPSHQIFLRLDGLQTHHIFYLVNQCPLSYFINCFIDTSNQVDLQFYSQDCF